MRPIPPKKSERRIKERTINKTLNERMKVKKMKEMIKNERMIRNERKYGIKKRLKKKKKKKNPKEFEK